MATWWSNLTFGALLVFFALQAHAEKTKGEYESAWREMATLITENGGWVHEGLKSNSTLHGGNEVRGVVASESFPGWTTLLRVPQKLLFTLDNFPELQNAALEELTECKAAHERDDLDTMRIAAALALEERKGNASEFNWYLRGLPTLSDFRTFFPRFMETDLLTDFGELPAAKIAQKQQQHDLDIRACFLRWQQVPRSPVSEVHWDEIVEAMSRYRTRGYNNGSNEMAVLVPGADLMNTEKLSRLNVVWKISNGSFSLITNSTVQPGSELYELYCDDCDNSFMMLVWGIYLEDNSNPLKGGPPVDCAARSNGGTVKSLQEAAESVLDLDSLPAAQSNGWTAPRCHASSLASYKQGPLRCSLARLAWEYCWQEWRPAAHESGAQPPLALLSKSSQVIEDSENFDVEEVARHVGRSFIQASQPALVSEARLSRPGSNFPKHAHLSFLAN